MFVLIRFLPQSQLVLCLVFAALPGVVKAAPIDIYDLRALVSEAAQRHPSVLNARALAGAADAEVQYAQKQRFPDVSVSAAAQGQGSTGAVTVKQPLWAGGAIDAKEALSRANLEVAQASADEQELTIALRTLEAWRNFALSQQKIKVVAEGMEQLNALIGMMQRRVDAQVSPRVELDLVKARLIQSQVERATLAAERDLAVRRLEELVGRVVSVSTPSTIVVQQWQTLMESGWPVLTPNEKNDVALDQPTVRRIRLEAKSAAREVQQTEANQWPQVYLQFQQGINAPVTNDKRVVLGVEYSPGRGFSSRQQVDVALARARAKEINIQTAIRDARDSLNAKLQAIDRAQTLAKSWEPSVAASEALLASYQRQFIAGRKSWQDVLNQQRELNQGRQSLIDARITWVATVAELELMRDAKPQVRLPSDGWMQIFFSLPSPVPVAATATKGMKADAHAAIEATAVTAPVGPPIDSRTETGLSAPQVNPTQSPKTVTKGAPVGTQPPAGTGNAVIRADELFGDDARLTAAGRQRLSVWINDVQGAYSRLDQVSVSGYSDPLADVSVVTAISQRRAQAVAGYLRDHGVQAQAWKIQWFGATRPVSTQCGFEVNAANRACHTTNRRVEIQADGVLRSATAHLASPAAARGK